MALIPGTVMTVGHGAYLPFAPPREASGPGSSHPGRLDPSVAAPGGWKGRPGLQTPRDGEPVSTRSDVACSGQKAAGRLVWERSHSQGMMPEPDIYSGIAGLQVRELERCRVLSTSEADDE